MPVAVRNAARLGCSPVASSVSMYSGQFDQLTILSSSDLSSAARSSFDFGAVPGVPHAASRLPRATAPAPRNSVRRVSIPRISGMDMFGSRVIALLTGESGIGAQRNSFGETLTAERASDK